MQNIYVQFEGMVYQQIVGIPIGTNCSPLVADLIYFDIVEGFLTFTNLNGITSSIDMFNDTSRYLDDIFTVDNPEFEIHISDIYYIQQNFC